MFDNTYEKQIYLENKEFYDALVKVMTEIINNTLISEEDKEIGKIQIYEGLCNIDWHNIEIKKSFSCSWRFAGGMISAIENDLIDDPEKHKFYLDYYCSGKEGNVQTWFAEKMKKLGWSFTKLK